MEETYFYESKDYIEKSYMVFVEDEKGMFHNNKNRFGLRWDYAVNKEVVDTLFNFKNFKVSYVDKNGLVYSNWLS